MATLNPFGLLGDDDAEDPSLLLAAHQQAAAPASIPGQPNKAPAQAQTSAKSSANLPSKPLPPSQAVSESRNEGQRGSRGVGRGGFRGHGGRGFNREVVDNEDAFANSNGFSGGYRPYEDGDGGKAPSERRSYVGPRDGGGALRGGHGGGFNNGEGADSVRPRRAFERRSGTGRGIEFKREGAGRGNWGTPIDEIAPEIEEATNEVKNVDSEKESGQDDVGDANKDSSANEQEETKPEEKEMTLEEYEKVLEEKRKALLALKSEERKVNLDKELEAMQLLSNKKNDDEVFIKLGSGKDKRKEAAEKAKKCVSINEFLKPAEGNYYRGGNVKGRHSVGGNNYNSSRAAAIAIGDVGQFPSLGGK